MWVMIFEEVQDKGGGILLIRSDWCWEKNGARQDHSNKLFIDKDSL